MGDDNTFWDNPYNDFFDLNGDGQASLDEQVLAYEVFNGVETGTGIDEGFAPSLFDDELSDDDEFEDDLDKDYTLDEDDDKEDDDDDDDEEEDDEDDVDEDDEDDDEDDTNEDGSNTITYTIKLRAADAANCVQEAGYPNRRSYLAACALATDPIFVLSPEYEKQEQNCCRFILEKADTVIAAKYLSYSSGFLYSQAIKDNFELPISLPDEDEEKEISLLKILCKLAKRDFSRSFKIWDWCIKQFLPYAEYDRHASYDITTDVINNIYDFPDGYIEKLLHYMSENIDFLHSVIGTMDFTDILSGIIAVAIEEQLYSVAEFIFVDAMKKIENDWKEINPFISSAITECKNYDELETIEYFRDNLFPLVKAIDNGMVQDEIEEWEEEIANYIDSVENDCEQYRYTRKNAWRKNVPDGEEYGLDPCDYDTEDEYMAALEEAKEEAPEEAKVDWRDKYKGEDNYGLDPSSFETEDDYLDELQEKQEEERCNECEERMRRRLLAEKSECDPAALNDKNVYIYCGVLYNNPPYRIYHYRAADSTIKVGDTVLLPAGNKEAEATVVSVGEYNRIAVPFPLEKTKFIIRKISK